MDKESNVLPLSMELEIEHIMREVKSRFKKLSKPKDRIGEWVFMRDPQGFTEWQLSEGREELGDEQRHVFYCHFLPDQVKELNGWIILAVFGGQKGDREGIKVVAQTEDGQQASYAALLKIKKGRGPKLSKWQKVSCNSGFFEIVTDIFNGENPCKSDPE